jgi:hypothetical protein
MYIYSEEQREASRMNLRSQDAWQEALQDDLA